VELVNADLREHRKLRRFSGRTPQLGPYESRLRRYVTRKNRRLKADDLLGGRLRLKAMRTLQSGLSLPMIRILAILSTIHDFHGPPVAPVVPFLTGARRSFPRPRIALSDQFRTTGPIRI
jgi:hypothetical protein